jgi:hypothetical protein
MVSAWLVMEIERDPYATNMAAIASNTCVVSG